MRIRSIIMAALGAGFMVAAAAPAFADRDDWRRHEWREHAWREREWREHEWREHHWRAYEPPVVVAPPPAYYAPPPVYYSPGVSFGVTIH